MLPSDRSLTQWIAAFCGDAARVALKGGDRCAVEAMAPVGAGRNRVILKLHALGERRRGNGSLSLRMPRHPCG